MRTFRLGIVSVLFAMGLLLFLDDLYTILRYGCDINDVAAIDPCWGPIDWPTGEKPTFALIPAYVYSFAFWSVGALILVPQPKKARPREGHVLRGTE